MTQKRKQKRIRANIVRLGIPFFSTLLLLASVPSSSLAASIVPPNVASESLQEEVQQDSDASSVPQTKDSTLEETTTKTTMTTPEQPNTITDMNTKDGSSSATTCRWGEHCPDTSVNPKQQQQQQQQDNASDTEQQQQQHAHLPPFVSNKHSTSTKTTTPSPPEGFVISARVYTDPTDKLAHFDDGAASSSSSGGGGIVLEYWECGASGSVTAPLVVKHAYFRHAMPRAAPVLWSGTEYGTHPQLLVALKPLELILNSGEEQVFDAGDVILLEDVLAAGHKIRSPHDHQDLSALILTLPQHYHHVGKDRVSLATTTTTSSSRNRALVGCGTNRDALVRERIRKTAFAAIGLAISSLFAVFLGKVAPLWLSVGVGGICFITGGTWAAVQCGEYVWQEGELALERHRLAVQNQEEQDKEDVQHNDDVNQ